MESECSKEFLLQSAKKTALMESIARLMLEKPDDSDFIKLSNHQAKVRAYFNPLYQHLLTMGGYSDILSAANATLDDLYRLAVYLQSAGFAFLGRDYLPVALVSFGPPLEYLLGVRRYVFSGTENEIRTIGQRAVEIFIDKCLSVEEKKAVEDLPFSFINADTEEESAPLDENRFYVHIKNTYEEIANVIGNHDELDIAPKGLDDIPAIIYTVADFVAFAEQKDRAAVYNSFTEWLSNDYFYTGLFQDRESLNDYIERRIDFYGSLQQRQITGLWVLGQERSQFNEITKNPIRCIAAAFIDCIIDSSYIDNYGRGELLGNLDTVRSIQIASTLLIPITSALEKLALKIID